MRTIDDDIDEIIAERERAARPRSIDDDIDEIIAERERAARPRSIDDDIDEIIAEREKTSDLSAPARSEHGNNAALDLSGMEQDPLNVGKAAQNAYANWLMNKGGTGLMRTFEAENAAKMSQDELGGLHEQRGSLPLTPVEQAIAIRGKSAAARGDTGTALQSENILARRIGDIKTAAQKTIQKGQQSRVEYDMPDNTFGAMMLQAIESSGFTVESALRSGAAWALDGPVLGALMSIVNTGVEADSEAGSVFMEMVKRGASPEQIQQAVETTRAGNFGTLLASNTFGDWATFGAEKAFGRLAEKIGGSGMRSSLAKTATRDGLPYVANALPEMGEELLQERTSQIALGDKADWQKAREAAAAGGVGGILYPLIGRGTMGMLNMAMGRGGKTTNAGETPSPLQPSPKKDISRAQNFDEIQDILESTSTENDSFSVEGMPDDAGDNQDGGPVVLKGDALPTTVIGGDTTPKAGEPVVNVSPVMSGTPIKVDGTVVDDGSAAPVAPVGQKQTRSPGGILASLMSGKTDAAPVVVAPEQAIPVVAPQLQQGNEDVAEIVKNAADVMAKAQGNEAAPVVRPEAPVVEPASDVPTPGKDSIVRYRENGDLKETPVRYEIVEADTLKTSRSEGYPQELQPRDTDKPISDYRVGTMAADLKAELLGFDDFPDRGAPTAKEDGVVVAGNHRTWAVDRAYDAKTEGAEKYREYLAGPVAQELGDSPERIMGMKKPVLVRKLQDGSVNLRAFAEDANASVVGDMGASEQAKMDADKISDAMLNTFDVDDAGTITRDFVESFAKNIVRETEMGRFLDKDGQLSQDGIRRIRNALVTRAYGDPALVGRISESTDDNMKRVSNGIMAAAPVIARMEGRISKGILHPLSIRQDLMDAVKLVHTARNEGRNIEEYLTDQTGLFDQKGYSEETKALARFLYSNKASTKAVREFLTRYAQNVERLGAPNEQALPGTETDVPTKRELVSRLLGVQTEGQRESAGLFDGVDEKPVKRPDKQAVAKIREEIRNKTKAQIRAEHGDEIAAKNGLDATANAIAEKESANELAAHLAEKPKRSQTQEPETPAVPGMEKNRTDAPARVPFGKMTGKMLADEESAIRDAKVGELIAAGESRERAEAEAKVYARAARVAATKRRMSPLEWEASRGEQGKNGIPVSVEENIAKGTREMNRVIRTHKDSFDAMYRKDVGSISFYWGIPGTGKKLKGGSGVSHLIARRNAEGSDGESVARKMVDVIAKGNVVRRYGAEGMERVDISHEGHTAVLSLFENGNRRTWLLTGWKDYYSSKEKSSDAGGEGFDSPEATRQEPTRTRLKTGAEDFDNNIALPDERDKTADSDKGNTGKVAENGSKAESPGAEEKVYDSSSATLSGPTRFQSEEGAEDSNGNIALPEGHGKAADREAAETGGGEEKISRWAGQTGQEMPTGQPIGRLDQSLPTEKGSVKPGREPSDNYRLAPEDSLEDSPERRLQIDTARFGDTVDEILAGKLDNASSVHVMTTPLAFNLVGARVLPVHMQVGKIAKVMREHGISSRLLKQIPTALADPIAILESDSEGKYRGLVAMLELKDERGATIVAAMHLEVTPERKGLTVNRLASVYGKGNSGKANDQWFASQIEKGNLRYINKQKSSSWLGRAGIEFTGGASLESFLDPNIPTEKDLVKLKEQHPGNYRLGMRDSEHPVTLEGLRRSVPGAKVTDLGDGKYRLDLHNGESIIVSTVKEIPMDPDIVRRDYGREPAAGEVVAGASRTIDGKRFIELAEGIAGEGTLDHEIFETARNMALTAKEKATLDTEIGSTEDQAEAYREFQANRKGAMTGRIVRVFQKLKDFFGAIRARLFGKKSLDVFREIAQGKVWGREARGTGADAYALGAEAEAGLNEDSAKFGRAVDAFVAGKLNPRQPIPVMTTPLALHLAGADVVPMTINHDTMKKVLVDHNLSRSMLKKIPSAMADPVMVFQSDSRADSVVVLLEIRDPKRGSVVVPVALNRVIDSDGTTVNQMTSVYFREKSSGKPQDEWIISQIEKGNLRYIDKQKSSAWDTLSGQKLSDGTNLSTWMRKQNFSTQNIHTEEDLVKAREQSRTRYSLAQKPSGTPQEWEKVRDKFGIERVNDLEERTMSSMDRIKAAKQWWDLEMMDDISAVKKYFGEEVYMRVVNALHGINSRAQALIEFGDKEHGVRSLYDIFGSMPAEEHEGLMHYCVFRHLLDIAGSSEGAERLMAPLKQSAKEATDKAKELETTLPTDEFHHRRLLDDAKKARKTAQNYEEQVADLQRQIKTTRGKAAQYRAAVARLEQLYPHWKQAQQDLVGFSRHLLEKQRDAGVVSDELYSLLTQKYPNYIPLQRDFGPDGDLEGAMIRSKGIVNLLSPIKRLKGSKRDVIDPLYQIVANAYTVEGLVGKQAAAREIVRMVDRGDYEGLIDPTDTPWSKPGEYVFHVWEGGKKRYFKTTPDIYMALVMSTAPNIDGVIAKILQAPVRALREGVTHGPGFILRNPIRDTFQAGVVGEHFVPFVDTLRGIFHVWKQDTVFAEFMKSGAMQGLAHLDPKSRKRMAEMIRAGKGTERLTDELRNPPRALWRALGAASALSELGTRVGQYQKVRQYGGSQERAAFVSRDILNYMRGGRTSKQISKYVPFFNASVQGVSKGLRAIYHDGKVDAGTLARSVLYITLPSLLTTIWNLSDDDRRKKYLSLPAWRRNLFWNVFVGGHHFMIPKPFELGVVFGSIPERFVDYLFANDRKAFNGMATSLYNAVMPEYMPLSFLLPLELNANYSTFYERNIVPLSQTRLVPKLQYGAYTSEWAKWAGEKFGLSPRKLEYAVLQLTGGSGKDVSNLADKAFRAVEDETRPARDWYEETPGVSSFVSRARMGQRWTQMFQDEREEIDMLFRSAKQIYENSGRGALTLQERRILGAENAVRQVNQLFTNKGGIDDLRREISKVTIAKGMSAEEKRARVDRLEAKIGDLSERGLAYIDRIKKSMNRGE